jgi:transcriptional regulator with XRE-family HTH domain
VIYLGVLEIADAIKKARISAGLTQLQAAEKLGITYQAISNYERGKTRVDTDTLRKLCDIYGISVLDVFTEQKNPANEVVDGLTPAEAGLIQLFRLVPADQQAMVLSMIDAALKSRGLL